MSEKSSLVLLPGLLCTRALWAAQIEGLAELAVTVVPELTGFNNLGDMAGEVLDKAPERFSLAGFSMGGYVALEIMRRAPERVARLAFLDTSARADTADQAARRRGLIELVEKGQFRGVAPSLIPLVIHPDRIDDSVLVGVISAMAEDLGREVYLDQQRAILGRSDSRGVLAQITCPTVVLAGRQDLLTPLDHSEEIAAAVPGADLVVIEDCGHTAPLEQPEDTTAALRNWLEK